MIFIYCVILVIPFVLHYIITLHVKNINYSSSSTPKSKPCLVKRTSSGETSENEGSLRDTPNEMDLMPTKHLPAASVARRLRASPNTGEIQVSDQAQARLCATSNAGKTVVPDQAQAILCANPKTILCTSPSTILLVEASSCIPRITERLAIVSGTKQVSFQVSFKARHGSDCSKGK